MNSVSLVGHLAADPEKSKTKNDKPMSKFSIAVNRTYRDEQGEIKVDYFDIIAFGRSADFVNNYCLCGHKIAITGHLETFLWTDLTGTTRKKVSIVARTVDSMQRNPEKIEKKKGRKKAKEFKPKKSKLNNLRFEEESTDNMFDMPF